MARFPPREATSLPADVDSAHLDYTTGLTQHAPASSTNANAGGHNASPCVAVRRRVVPWGFPSWYASTVACIPSSHRRLPNVLRPWPRCCRPRSLATLKTALTVLRQTTSRHNAATPARRSARKRPTWPAQHNAAVACAQHGTLAMLHCFSASRAVVRTSKATVVRSDMPASAPEARNQTKIGAAGAEVVAGTCSERAWIRTSSRSRATPQSSSEREASRSNLPRSSEFRDAAPTPPSPCERAAPEGGEKCHA